MIGRDRAPALPTAAATRRRALGTLLALALVGVAPPIGGSDGDRLEPVWLPFWSKSAAKTLTDRAAVRVVGTLRYKEVSEAVVEKAVDKGDQDWTLYGLPGMEVARFFEKNLEKKLGDGTTRRWKRRLTLALVPRTGNGYEVFVVGVEIDGDESRPNPDREDIVANIQQRLSEVELARPGAPSDRYLIYQLSYVQSDRAVALLKTLGYSVVEYETESEPGKGTPFDAIFGLEEAYTKKRRPLIINLIDAQGTSLVREKKGAARDAAAEALDLGGQTLDEMTTGGPQQRLLIVWDEEDPRGLDELGELLDLLHGKIDVPAKQILIEALVIELDQDLLREIGISFTASKDGQSVSLEEGGGLTLSLARPTAKTLFEFTAQISALVDDERAQVLSRPSVLVLDGRQARIQVGDKLPYTDKLVPLDSGQVLASTGYLGVGIVLNLRPRVSDDNSEITMQVETLISSARSAEVQSDLLIGPEIQSREVQTLVRVANDTPFIIGGLITETTRDVETGVPGLKNIPLIGRLFRKDTTLRENKEVIVVITPHVIEPEDSSFSYGPKDSAAFDSFGHELFRNIYRVRRTDVFDLDFIRESDFYNCLAASVLADAREQLSQTHESPSVDAPSGPPCPRYEPPEDLESLLLKIEEDPTFNPPESYLRLLGGGIPGEEILVRRMLLGTIERLEYGRLIPRDHLIYFALPDGQCPAGTHLVASERQAYFGIQSLSWELEEMGLFEDECKTVLVSFPSPGLDEQVKNFGDQKTVFDSAGAVVCKQSFPPSCFRADDDGGRELKDECFNQKLLEYNPDGGDRTRGSLGIVLNECYRRRGFTSFDHLRNVLVLKKLLDLNPNLPRTLEGFHAGRELIFPEPGELKEIRELVDPRAAQLYYQTLDYYRAFEIELRRALELPEFGRLMEDLKLMAPAKTGDAGTARPPSTEGGPAIRLVVRYRDQGPGAVAPAPVLADSPPGRDLLVKLRPADPPAVGPRADPP